LSPVLETGGTLKNDDTTKSCIGGFVADVEAFTSFNKIPVEIINKFKGIIDKK
jgi:hypothetical protein